MIRVTRHGKLRHIETDIGSISIHDEVLRSGNPSFETRILCYLADRLEKQPAAAQEAVAYLDIGAGGYLDLGSNLPEVQLLALPKGRHALGIIGTYGIDGYAAAPVATGKRQVGEVQGDALATIIAALEHSKPTHAHYPEPVKRHADALAHARALAARQPGAEEPVSPMAKMAAALREKAAIEHTEYSQRVQSGEWGTIPEAGTQADFCRYCEGSGWGGESRKTKCPACSGTGMPVPPAQAVDLGQQQDAARWRYIRRKLCLNGNGNGTCSMQAINLPSEIPGWPEPGEVAEFCDKAIDAAMQATSAELGS